MYGDEMGGICSFLTRNGHDLTFLLIGLNKQYIKIIDKIIAETKLGSCCRL